MRNRVERAGITVNAVAGTHVVLLQARERGLCPALLSKRPSAMLRSLLGNQYRASRDRPETRSVADAPFLQDLLGGLAVPPQCLQFINRFRLDTGNLVAGACMA